MVTPKKPVPSIPHTTAPRWPAVAAGRFAATLRRDSAQGCRVALLGLPDDTGVRLNHGRPGARNGPAAFRAALPALDRPVPPACHFRRSSTPATCCRRARSTKPTAGSPPPPPRCSNSDSSPSPSAAATTSRSPLSARSPPGFRGWPGVYFDAHLDVRETAGSGMPFRRLVEDCGVGTLHLHGFRPLVNSREHLAWFKTHGGKLHRDGAAVRWPAARNLFASFDLDVLDAVPRFRSQRTQPCRLDRPRSRVLGPPPAAPIRACAASTSWN